MTEEELQKEVEEYISSTPTEGAKDFVVYKVKVGKNAFAYVVEHKNELCFSDWIKMYEGTERECYKVVGYLDSAEPREKRIAELIALINAERKRQEKCDDVHLRKIATLEKENAELKADNSEWEKASDKWKSVYELTNKQLIKAKEIIREFMKYEINEYDGSLEIHFEELKKQAEQFLKD